MIYSVFVGFAAIITQDQASVKPNTRVNCKKIAFFFTFFHLKRLTRCTLLWNTVAREEGDAFADMDEQEAITFEVYAKDEKDAWIKGEDYMYNNYNQELYNADTTITKVGA